MENGLIPTGGNSGGALATQTHARGIVAPSQDMMGGGGGFSESWSINKDKHVFVNKKTNEERQALYIIVDEMHANRVLFPKTGEQKGERACWSDDGVASHLAVVCASCPHVAEDKAFNAYYEKNPQQQRPPYVGDCSTRLSVLWKNEFVVAADNSITLQKREDHALLNGPKSSLIAMWNERQGYMKKLKDQGLDITKVVTKVKLVQRENADLKSVYDYADFELAGKIEDIMARVARTVEIRADAPAAQHAPAQTSFPTSTVALPLGAPAAAPAATGFPPVTSGFPAGAGAAFGAPAATAPAVAPGFPAAAPGFPGVAQPVAAAPAAAAPAAGPSFQDMARAQLVQNFNALGGDVKGVVLNVLGVARIEDVTDAKLIQATQAVNSAKGFSPAPAAVGASAGNPF